MTTANQQQTTSTVLSCQLCGCSPAVSVTLRRHVGMLIVQRFCKWQGTLCHDHGVEIANIFLRKTLVQGWWGATSFFLNWFAVATDLVALQRASRLPSPEASQADGEPPAATSADFVDSLTRAGSVRAFKKWAATPEAQAEIQQRVLAKLAESEARVRADHPEMFEGSNLRPDWRERLRPEAAGGGGRQ